MHQYLQNALEILTAKCNRSALHPLDEDLIKLHLRVLNAHGIPLDADEIQSWLQARGWQDRVAKKFVNWATTVSEGGRVQLKNARNLPAESEVWNRVQKQSN